MNGKCLMGVLLVAGMTASGGEVFHWKGGSGEWLDWGETSSWETYAGGTMTDATRLPGAGDSIYYPNPSMYTDLGGQSWSIGSYSMNATPRTNTYLMLTNGTLTVTSVYNVYAGIHEVFDGGTFVIAPTVANMYESQYNAGHLAWTVHSGGRLDITPKTIDYFQGYTTIEAGGTVRLEPQTYKILSQPWPNAYYNHGMMIVTNGMDFTGHGVSLDVTHSTNHKESPTRPRNGAWAYLAVDHFEGELKLGGRFDNGGIEELFPFFMTIRGGTVEAVKDVVFQGFDCAVSNDAAVTVRVLEGATMNMSPFVFGENVSITKTGAGEVIFGEEVPKTVVAEEGVVRFDFAQPESFTALAGSTIVLGNSELDLSAMGVAAGVTLKFAAAGFRFDSLEGYEDLLFAVSTKDIVPGETFFSSANADLLAYVKESIAARLGSDFDLCVVGDGLMLLPHVDHVFDAMKGVGLDDPSGWGEGTVPVGADVTIRGAAEVAFGASSPSFKSISVEIGATLLVSGGTEEVPIALPPLKMNGNATIRFLDGSWTRFANGLQCKGNAEVLPVFEICSNAVVVAQDPDYPNRGIYFSNVDFRLYGQLRVPTASDNGNYLGSQMFFGYAAAGETAYLAFKSEGGSIYAPHNAAAYVGNRSLVSFASPAVGGRVKVVGEIVLRDFRKIQDLTQPDNPRCLNANSGYCFGVNNPADEEFDVIVDNTLLCPGGPTRFAGGCHARFINGADLRRPEELLNNASYGHTRGAFLADRATLEFEGGSLRLDRSCGTDDLGRGLRFDAAEEGETVLTLSGGAQMTLWETYGNGKGVCEVSDGTFNVDRYFPPRMQYFEDRGWVPMGGWTCTNTAAFAGLKGIRVPEGGTLRFNATDTYRPQTCGENTPPEPPNPVREGWWTDPGNWEWHRKTALEIPVSGAGDVHVVNTLSGPDFRNEQGWVTDVTYPDVSAWSMNLVVRNGENTCTGRISADPSVNAFVHFADGANWAGTVVANGHVRMGDPILEVDQGHAAAPATATFHALELTGDFPLRVWKNGDEIVNDRINVATAANGNGRFVLESVEGTVENGDKVVLGRYPANAELPRVKGCAVAAEPIVGDDDHVTLTATRGLGAMLLLR